MAAADVRGTGPTRLPGRHPGMVRVAFALALLAVTATTQRWFGGIVEELLRLKPMLYWSTMANTALAGATLLYFAHALLRHAPVGRAANALAALGLVGGLFAFAVHWLRTDTVPAAVSTSVTLIELTAGCAIAAVAASLVAQWLYRNSRPAMLIMPAVMLAVACEIWLVSRGATHDWAGTPGLAGYWDAAFRVASMLGYSACAAGAVTGVVLWHAARARPDASPRAETPAFAVRVRVARHDLMCAAAVGVALLALAGGLGALSGLARHAPGGSGFEGIMVALPPYVLLYAAGATALLRDRWVGAFAVLAFAAATVALAPPPDAHWHGVARFAVLDGSVP